MTKPHKATYYMMNKNIIKKGILNVPYAEHLLYSQSANVNYISNTNTKSYVLSITKYEIYKSYVLESSLIIRLFTICCPLIGLGVIASEIYKNSHKICITAE